LATVLSLKADPVYADVWADTTQAGVTARPSISLLYTGNANAANNLTTPVPVNGVINYPDHIQPIWAASRAGGSCVSCHADPNTLDLTSTIAGTGRMASYESLTLGPPLLDASGKPVLQVQDGVLVVARGPALVETMASESAVVGLARQSRLTEILFGQMVMSSAAAQAQYPTPASPNHATMLNSAEKRLVTEWVDTGGKYYNDPFNTSSGMRAVAILTQASFQAIVYPILQSTCAAGCHMAIGSNQTAPAGTSFVENKFVLTGNPEGDFNNTLTMITDTCNPATNYLLSKPSTVPHPAGAQGQTSAILPAGSANYTAIANWIATGCPTP